VDGGAEQLHRHGHERQRDQRPQREPRVDRDHDREGHRKRQQRVRRIHDRRADHHPHRVEIVGRARHQVAGAVRLEIRQRQLLQVREEVVAHVVLDVAGGADQNPAREELEDAAEQTDREQQRAVAGQLAARHALCEIVDRAPEHGRPGERDRSRHHDACQAEDELAAVAQNVGEQAP
jgi:hypothetical protein